MLGSIWDVYDAPSLVLAVGHCSTKPGVRSLPVSNVIGVTKVLFCVAFIEGEWQPDALLGGASLT